MLHCYLLSVMRLTVPHMQSGRISRRNCWWSNWVGWTPMRRYVFFFVLFAFDQLDSQFLSPVDWYRSKSTCSSELPKWIRHQSIAADSLMWIEIYLNRSVRLLHPKVDVFIKICDHLQLLTTMVTYLVVLLQFQISIPDDTSPLHSMLNGTMPSNATLSSK